MRGVTIHPCSAIDQFGWLELRLALWPHATREEHLAEMAQLLALPERHAQFIAFTEGAQSAGLAEVSLRADYVNGTDSSPVAFLEGLYVAPAFRGHGIARELVGAVMRWAQTRGCTELASDALLDNETAHAAHRALGFEETERVVFFRKRLEEA